MAGTSLFSYRATRNVWAFARLGRQQAALHPESVFRFRAVAGGASAGAMRLAVLVSLAP